MTKIKLFCIPYAGGSASVYGKWRPYLNRDIDIIQLELAGRGKRFTSDQYRDIEEAVTDVYGQLKEEITPDTPYAIFGHSMGSLIALELAYKIYENNLPPLAHLFLSGRKPPDDCKEATKYHKLPNDEFLHEVKKYGGMTEEILAQRKLMEIFLPIIRNDFRIIETHSFSQKGYKLDCSISAFYGKKDEMTEQDMQRYERFSLKACKVYGFDSGHFFIVEDIERVTAAINDILLNCSYSGNSNRDGLEG